jgi:hypothetical protein
LINYELRHVHSIFGEVIFSRSISRLSEGPFPDIVGVLVDAPLKTAHNPSRFLRHQLPPPPEICISGSRKHVAGLLIEVPGGGRDETPLVHLVGKPQPPFWIQPSIRQFRSDLVKDSTGSIAKNWNPHPDDRAANP